MVEQLIRDQNHVPVAGGVSSTSATTVLPFKIDPVTGRLLVDNAGGGSGDVSGPGSSTDQALVRWDGTSGTLVSDSAVKLTSSVLSPFVSDAIALGSTTLMWADLFLATGGVINWNAGDVTITHSANTLTFAGASSGYSFDANVTALTSVTVGAASGTTGSILLKGTTSGTVTLSVADAAGTWTMKLPTDDGTPNQFLQTDGSGNTTWATPSGTGDVVGPASATDNAVARFDGTTGKLIQNSAVTIADTSGDITGGKYNGLTITTSTGTLTIANGKTLTASNTLTFTGTDGSSVNFGTGGTVLYAASTIPLTVGSTTIASGTTTRILYDNAGVLGEYTLTGSGTVVAMQTAPTFATSITTPSVLATANDSGALGASGTAFADLFLASGGVINWAAGDYTLTHSSGILTANKDFRITSANVGTNADSVPTLSSTSTLTNKTLTSPAITTGTYTGAQQLAENASIQLDPAGSADGKFSGITVTGTSDYTQAFGDLVYLKASNSRWAAADADAATTAGPVALAMVVVTGTSGNACTLLLQGIIRADAKFPTMTVGATQYVGETAGEIQGTIPTGADNIIRTVGYALTADELYFNPSTDWQVTVA